jgi:hypothetical protein
MPRPNWLADVGDGTIEKRTTAPRSTALPFLHLYAYEYTYILAGLRFT